VCTECGAGGGVGGGGEADFEDIEKALLFEKKEAKNSYLLRIAASAGQTATGAKVFCFFFSKKKRFLTITKNVRGNHAQ
jgi:hypothetical protein